MESHPWTPKFIIFDLDGLLLDTESLCFEVGQDVVGRHGKTMTLEAQKAALGKRPLECWADIAQVLQIDASPQTLLDESEPLLLSRWPDARLLPGAKRLLLHLHHHSVPFAIATSTPRTSFDIKLSKKPEIKALLKLAVCGDEVVNGKPHGDVFQAAAKLLAAPASECLVFEDAPSGVTGATAAGMRVVVVPSLVQSDEYPKPDPSASQGVVQVLPSLLAFDPAAFALPPFEDLVHGVIPLDDVIRIRGNVVKGFGRGSKDLGIPTANVDSASLRSVLAEAVTGIYCGFAAVGESTQVHQMVMSIGWNPFYGNKEKTAEPWLLAEFKEPFYDQEIRLVLVGYVRPEANFTTLQALIDRIHRDGELTRLALAEPRLAHCGSDPFLVDIGAVPDGPAAAGVAAGAAS